MCNLQHAIFSLFMSCLLTQMTYSQFPFSLHIPSVVKCAFCKFHWPALSHYGYSFDVDVEGSTIDLELDLVSFASIAINYNSYDSTHSSCSSGFVESFHYQISIYYRSFGSNSWTTQATKSGRIDSATMARISLTNLDPPVVLTTGRWYIGMRLSWMQLAQQCDFIVDGWNISAVSSLYPLNISSFISDTNHQITFKRIKCLQGDLSTNTHKNFTASILPHFDIEFELMTLSPTKLPTSDPITATPTIDPSVSPSFNPTQSPTNIPTIAPTHIPSQVTHPPSLSPTKYPSYVPTAFTLFPSTTPTVSPTLEPTQSPSIDPTISPTLVPSIPPTEIPTLEPTNKPTLKSIAPTSSPSVSPSEAPTHNPTSYPTPEPTAKPTSNPSQSTFFPTVHPTTQPTIDPTLFPTVDPTQEPTQEPTRNPSFSPSYSPTLTPTKDPTLEPTLHPTNIPSIDPSFSPSNSPTLTPTDDPTIEPTLEPTISPTDSPSFSPSRHPSSNPTYTPSLSPSASPTMEPTNEPTLNPTKIPSIDPTVEPTSHPTADPTADPSTAPSSPPTNTPSLPPTKAPTQPPTIAPSIAPSSPPTTAPTPHCPAVHVNVEAHDAFDVDDFNGLYTFVHKVSHDRPVWEVHQIPSDKNIKYTGTHWIINGEHDGVLSHVSNTYYPPQYIQWTHSNVSGLFTVDIKCIHTFAPVAAPTSSPTQPPTTAPTYSPTAAPTVVPTNDPTMDPTLDPTVDPTYDPSNNPTLDPTMNPTYVPSMNPTAAPSISPTYLPSVAPSFAPSNMPSNTPSNQPTLYPTDSPVIRISPNATHVKMVFLWNVSKTLQYLTFKNNKEDINEAIISVSEQYYNALMSITEVYVYGDGALSWFHLDIFALCRYEPADECAMVQQNETRFKSRIINELIKLKSKLANMNARLIMERLSESEKAVTFYPDTMTIASAQLSPSGLIIKLNFEYSSIHMQYTHDTFSCKEIFVNKTVQLFGSNHYCTWSTSTVLLIHLGFNHDIDFAVESKQILLYHHTVFLYMPPIILQTALIAPHVISSPNVIISGSRHIGICDNLWLTAGSTEGNMGKSLYYEWKVYFETQFLTQSKGFESQFKLSQAALQTFGVELLRIELHSKNWLDGNNTNIVYIHYDKRRNLPSLEIQGGNIHYHSFWTSNIIITPHAKPSLCGRNTDYNHYIHYSWQQIYEFPNELTQEPLLWTQTPYITQYAFDFNENSKALWINDTFEFYSVFILQNNVSVLPSAYFKLSVTQLDSNYLSLTPSVYDYIAIQFVFDLPLPHSVHTVIHNADNSLTLTIYDFFTFPDLLLSENVDAEDWIQTIYQFEWECFIFDTIKQQYSTSCDLDCPLNNVFSGAFPNYGTDEKKEQISETEKVFESGCFDNTQNMIYQISLNTRLYEVYSNNISSIIYIKTNIDSSISSLDISWNNYLPQHISSSIRNRLSLSWNSDNDTISNIKWICSDSNICPHNQSLSESLGFMHVYTDYASKSSHVIVHPYSIYDYTDKYGCYVDAAFNTGAQYELQMIADNNYSIATASISTSVGIKGEECSVTVTDDELIPLITIFTIQCGEFTTSAFPVMYNFLLINNNVANDEGVWMNAQFIPSSFFQFVLAAGNYSVRVVIQDSIGDVLCFNIPQNIIMDTDHMTLNVTNYAMNAILHAVSVSDHSQLIQHTLALSNTLSVLHYDTFRDIVNVVDIYLNFSHYIFNISDLNDFFRYKTMIAIYKTVLTDFEKYFFDEIMNISTDIIIEQKIDILYLLQKVHLLTQTLPYNVLQTYFTTKTKWSFTDVITYDLYSDFLSIIHIMHQNRNSLLLYIEHIFKLDDIPNVDIMLEWIHEIHIKDHNMYLQTIEDLIKRVNLIFSNQFTVGEGILWTSADNMLQIKASRSETNAIDCGVASTNIPPMINYIATSKTDCIVLKYTLAPWKSIHNVSEIISISMQIDLYSVNDETGAQNHIETLQMYDTCDIISFRLPIINPHQIDYNTTALDTNTSYSIPQCAYFDFETESWSDSGCWIVNYTLNDTLCACDHFGIFTLISTEFQPSLSIITQQDTKTLEWNMLLQDPVCWMFVIALILLFILALLCVPPVNNIPLIARSNIILKIERDEMLSSSWIGRVMTIMRHKDKQNCAKMCSLYVLNLRNHHSLLTICCAMEGMNISTTNMLLLFMCYIVTVMIFIGLYYARIVSDLWMNSERIAICASLVSIIPLLLCRYLLKNAKPLTASSHYLTVQEKTAEPATDCVPLINEDHSVSYSSLNTAPHQKPEAFHDHNSALQSIESNDDLIIIPGAEWKCNRCNKFNDSDYQFCGYCSHKRLSVVQEATLEASNSDLVFNVHTYKGYTQSLSPQPGSTQVPTMPSCDAPKPMQPHTNSAKHRKKKRHCYNISDSSDIGTKYEHNPQQSSILSSVFADDDIESDSIVISDDEDEGMSSDSNTATYTKYKKQNVSHDDKNVTESALSGIHKKPWSMCSASPSLSAVSHTTNTTIGTNIDTDFNASFGNLSKVRNRGNKHQSNLSDFSDPHSQIGDIKGKISMLHGTSSPASPIGGLRHNIHRKHYQGKSSTFLSPTKLKHNRGISSMSSGLVNYNIENDSFFMMTDMETSVDNDIEVQTPYASDHEEEQQLNSLLDAFAQTQTGDLQEDIDRQTPISRRASKNNGTLIARKEKFALPKKYDTKRSNVVVIQQEEKDKKEEEEEETDGYITKKEEEEKEHISVDAADDSLSRVLMKVQHINDMRQEVIRRNYKLPHCTKHCVAAFMWLYILIGCIVIIYVGTHFNTITTVNVDDSEWLSYQQKDSGLCSNINIPYQVQVNYALSQEYVSNVSAFADVYDLTQNDMKYSSTEWVVSVIFAVAFYIFIFLPIVLWIASMFMMYNVHRKRTFDINLDNICYGFLFYDMLCCFGQSCIWKNCKKHESDLVAKYGRKTKKHKKDQKNKDTKFHDIPQNEEDVYDELELSEINTMDTRNKVEDDSDSDDNEDDEKHQIIIYKHDDSYMDTREDNEDEVDYVQNSFTEYAFLCNDKIFVHPTNAEKKRLEFMNCDEAGSPSKLLQFQPSSIQKKFSLVAHHQSQSRKKKRNKKRKLNRR